MLTDMWRVSYVRQSTGCYQQSSAISRSTVSLVKGLGLECLDCILLKSPQPSLSKSISVVKKKKKKEGGWGSESLWNNIAYYYHPFRKLINIIFLPRELSWLIAPPSLSQHVVEFRRELKFGDFFFLQGKTDSSYPKLIFKFSRNFFFSVLWV